MSDDEEASYEDEEDEEDDDDDEEEDDDDDDDDDKSENSEEERKKKEVTAAEDAAIILDIFSYIDKTSKRISRSLLMEMEMREMRDDLDAFENDAARGTAEAKPPVAGDIEDYEEANEDGHAMSGRGRGSRGFRNSYDEYSDEDASVSWSHYGDLDDAQRAELLERALNVLGGKEDDVRQGKRSKSRERKERKTARGR